MFLKSSGDKYIFIKERIIMDAACRQKLAQALWFVTGAAALCVGLGALHINVLGALHLDGIDRYVRYLVGLAGLTSLVMFFMRCAGKKC